MLVTDKTIKPRLLWQAGFFFAIILQSLPKDCVPSAQKKIFISTLHSVHAKPGILSFLIQNLPQAKKTIALKTL